MNELQYNNQALNEYLLDSLPDAETERFDEMSFTDDDFADALKSAEKDLVDAYIHDELSAAMLEKFKTHYLASPVRREKVAFAKAFQVYAGGKVAEDLTEIKMFVKTKPKRNLTEYFAGIFTFSRPAMSLGAAFAALAIVFFGGWLWRENSRRQIEMSQANTNRQQVQPRETELATREHQTPVAPVTPNFAVNSETERELAQAREERVRLEERLKKQIQEKEKQQQAERLAKERELAEQQRTAQNTPNRAAIASFILAPSLRGGSRIQSVSIPADTATVAANLELETDEYITYRAVLRNPSDTRILWQSGKLKSNKAGGNKRLKLSFPAALLKPRIYSIEVSGIAADGEAEIISDYSFRIMR